MKEGDEIVAGRHALRLLGGGRRYEAYLAWDDAMYAVVVAKLLRPRFVSDAAARRTLTDELSMLRRLNHPGLLRCFDAVLTGTRPHLVLEHIDGPRLSTLLRTSRTLAIEQTIPLGLQLCSALHYMHSHGVVHLDVKPRNIIMAGPPRLIDLSVARSIDDARKAVHAIGTDAYMAPEQCAPQARGVMSEASDVWGWGVTMYEALAGTLPFPRPDRDGGELHPQLRLKPIAQPDHIPPPLAELIEACLAPDPHYRPTQLEVARRMEPLLAALPKRLVLSGLRPGLR